MVGSVTWLIGRNVCAACTLVMHRAGGCGFAGVHVLRTYCGSGKPSVLVHSLVEDIVGNWHHLHPGSCKRATLNAGASELLQIARAACTNTVRPTLCSLHLTFRCSDQNCCMYRSTFTVASAAR
jgi:hypothetical protein